MQDLRTTLIQAPLSWEDPAANRQYFTQKLAPLTGQTDLVVLPEMFTTGFTMNPAPYAEAMDGPTVTWLRERATALDAAVMGSLIIRENDRHYNRMVLVRPDGSLNHYDKRHPFTMSGELDHYERGTTNATFLLKGWRIRPQICYDLRFPVWSRNVLADPYDLLVYVASWPNKRAYDWRLLLRARAIENQAYVIGVNRIGTDANGHEYAGDSCVIDPGPRHALLDLENREAVGTVTLDAEHLRETRARLPFLQDGDGFTVG